MTGVKYLLFIFLCQCIVRSIAVNKFFELTKSAIEAQKKYKGIWNDYVENNNINKERGEYTTRKGEKMEAEFYKFNGDKAKKLKLNEAFSMLQNWAHIIGDNYKHHFFELNIGGEDFKFRLQKSPKRREYSNHQIFVYDIEGSRYKYNIFNILDKDNGSPQDRAKEMLKSLNEPLDAQTPWKENNEQGLIKKRMKQLMILSHIAESARPTDEYFDGVEKIMTKVTQTEILTAEQQWEKVIDEVLKNEKESLNEGKYNKLRESLLNEENRKKLLNAAREIIGSNGPEESFHSFLPETLAKNEDLRTELLTKAKEIVDSADSVAVKKFQEDIESFKPKFGRVPGTDVVMENLLKMLANGEISSLFESFVLERRGGTKLGREMWRPSLRKRMRDSFEHLSEDIPSKRVKIMDPIAIAASEGIESAVKEEVRKSSCTRKRKRRQSSCSFNRLKVVDGSVKLERTKLTFETFDDNGNRQTHEVNLNADKLSLTEYTEEHLANLEESGLIEKTGTALGVYGSAVNTLASINYFSNGEYGEGAFSAFQAAHGIGGLVGFNDVVSMVAKKTLNKLTTSAAEKVLSKEALETISKSVIKAVGESAAKTVGRLAGGLPAVGFALDVYFISEDIKELKDKNSSIPEALKVTHLVLDLETTVLSLVDTAAPVLTPIVEPIVMALTIIRMGIDNYYLDITEELSKVKGKGFGTKVVAFLKGFAKGTFDLLTLGLGMQIRQFERQQAQDRELLRNLSDPVNYFNVTFRGMDSDGNEVGTVDWHILTIWGFSDGETK